MEEFDIWNGGRRERKDQAARNKNKVPSAFIFCNPDPLHIIQTAMFGAFGEDSDIDPALMNGITGICMCVMILAIGIYMIRSAGRQRKRMQAEIQKGL